MKHTTKIKHSIAMTTRDKEQLINLVLGVTQKAKNSFTFSELLFARELYDILMDPQTRENMNSELMDPQTRENMNSEH